MKDSANVTQALTTLYQRDDWLLRLNFQALLHLSGLTRLSREAELLDCGCAVGHFMGLLARHGFRRVQGLDAAPDMAARARAATGLPVVAADALEMGRHFPPASLDALTAMNLQHHLGREQEWEAFLRECARLLRPGGMLFVREPWMTPAMGLLWWMSRRPLFFRVGLLRGRLQSLVEERELLGYFLQQWPAVYREQLVRQGFRVERDLSWMGHRIVAARRVASGEG
ncbi:MAG: class I SAM-dependent methyltransferase [Magnetococcales bacterium]|nr:class I SAM-dependent methyltransferase [Magnetococcales bacterium]